MLVDRPWSRVKTPVPIPDRLEPDALRELSRDDLARLLRDQLVPRQPAGPERDRWEQLWALLSRDDELADRAFDILEEFLDQAERALEGGELDEHQRRRAEKFRRFCEDAWQRLQRDDDRPLGWAGRAANGFNPAARRVLEHLVDAIVDHRRVVTATGSPKPHDEGLWRVLADVSLDPDLPRRRR